MWQRKNKTVPETRESVHSSWLISGSSVLRRDRRRRQLLGMGKMKRNTRPPGRWGKSDVVIIISCNYAQFDTPVLSSPTTAVGLAV